MSESGGMRGGNPAEEHRRIIERSMENEELRRRLLADPKGTVEEELGAKLPAEIEIRAVEETQNVVYLVLPPTARASQQASIGELSDRELEAVAGGWEAGTGDGAPTCQRPPICI